MQPLFKRDTYAPRDIPLVLGDCDLWLNNPEGRDSAANLKTLNNSPKRLLLRKEDET